MHTGHGQVMELVLQDGQHAARLSCPPSLIPSAGQYLLAGDASALLVPVPLFPTDSAPEGFLTGPVPESWHPGKDLFLRGPLGQGFTLPSSARKIALVAFDDSVARLRPLILPALNLGAAVVLVTNSNSEQVPDDVEVHPLSALEDLAGWADWIAFDVARWNLQVLRDRLGEKDRFSAWPEAEILIRTPIPCGGMADCGVCAVFMRSGWKMACKEGPVFRWGAI